MTVKAVARRQYQEIVDEAASTTATLHTPPEGWIRTIRKALGMSGAQLARRMHVTRSRINGLERAEMTGGVTLKSMQAAAEAMGCRFVYAIVPPHPVEKLIATQARRKATALVDAANVQMAMEDQAISNERIAREITRLGADLVREMPADLWDTK